MSVTRLNGATVEFASAYGTAVAFTAVTNATSAVLTLGTGHGIGTGDYFEFFTSGWDRLQGRPARASASTSTNVTAENVDTSSTTFYPGGTAAGAGTVREVTTFTSVAQVFQDGGVAISGGEQQFDTYGFLSSDIQLQAPTNKSPESIAIKYYYDRSQSFLALAEAREIDEPTMCRITLRSGAKIIYSGFLRLGSPVPDGSFWAQTMTISANSRRTEYTS